MIKFTTTLLKFDEQGEKPVGLILKYPPNWRKN